MTFWCRRHYFRIKKDENSYEKRIIGGEHVLEVIMPSNDSRTHEMGIDLAVAPRYELRGHSLQGFTTLLGSPASEKMSNYARIR